MGSPDRFAMGSDPGDDERRSRYMDAVRRLRPDRARRWVEESWSLLRETDAALNVMFGYPLGPEVEPAPFFSLAPFAPSTPKDLTGEASDPVRPRDVGGGAGSAGASGTPGASDPTDEAEAAGGPNPAGASDLLDLTVADAARLIRRGELSPVDLVRACLDAVEATDDRIAAWETIAEDALAQAEAAEKALRRGENAGPLHGIPFGVKDNIFTKGLRTAGGSRLYDDFIPAYDATAVAKLKAAGAVLLGKTTTTELAFGDAPCTRNPWHLDHTPGGSSSGSAAAVAARHVPFALGTQTGGSLSRPAGYCGVVVLKPTFGRISRHGVFPVSWSTDHLGAMTRSVLDQALLLSVLCGPDGLDPTALPAPPPRLPFADPAEALPFVRKLTVGVPDRYFVDGLHPAQRRAYDEAVQTLADDAAVTVKEIPLPPSFEAGAAAHTIITQSETASYNARNLRERGDLIGRRLRARIIGGLLADGSAYVTAQRIRRRYVQEMAALYSDGGIDLLVTPASPTPAPRGLEFTGSAVFNAPFSMAGFPTLVLPAGRDPETGLPLAVQLAAAPFQESVLLAVGLAYEKISGCPLERPPL